MKIATGPISTNQIFYVESFQTGVPMDKETLFYNLALALLIEANTDPHIPVDPNGFQVNIGVQYSANALTMTKQAATTWINAVLGRNTPVSTQPAVANPVPQPTANPVPQPHQVTLSNGTPINFFWGHATPVAVPAPDPKNDPTVVVDTTTCNAKCTKCGAPGWLLFNSIECSKGCP